MEYKLPDSDKWDFVRICHLDLDLTSSPGVMMGPFACAPTDAGGRAIFDYVKLETVEGYHHTN